LLNASYKILTKALALRVKYILLKIIKLKWTGFIRGRYILDNVIVSKNIEWVRSQGLVDLFVKIDFEKVYERVEWPSILAMLKVLGSLPFFVKAVETLFSEASICHFIH